MAITRIDFDSPRERNEWLSKSAIVYRIEWDSERVSTSGLMFNALGECVAIIYRCSVVVYNED